MSEITPRLTVTNYIDVVSSWCYWAAPAWQELQQRYAGLTKFQWKIALMDASGIPTSHAQMDWFYRRSGMMMRSPVMLKSAWHQIDQTEYFAPNAIAEAARELGVPDERVWLALARAGLLEGRNTGDWDIAAEIGAHAAGVDKAKLFASARS